MKKVILVLITLLLFNTVNAEKSAKEKVILINNVIEKSVGFPKIEKTTGDSFIVLVSFDVNLYGGIEVKQINAADEVFKNHVKEQLSKLDLSTEEDLIGESFNLKIKFVVK